MPDLDFYRWDNLFSAKGGSRWLDDPQADKTQNRLFGDLWLEGELAILFADTGRGKSILAVQIGQSIASGIGIHPFELTAPPQRVVYFDFELTAQQFAARYNSTPVLGGVAAASDDEVVESSPFSDNFIRAAPRFEDADIPDEYKDYTDYLIQSLIEFIRFSCARVVIIDNITWLNPSTHNVTSALRLMKELKRLKIAHDLSILVLAHTPKRYASSTITLNDLQGSKMLANFADNIFAMGASYTAPDVRYIKHLKFRNAAIRYDESNVLTLKLGRFRQPALIRDVPCNSVVAAKAVTTDKHGNAQNKSAICADLSIGPPALPIPGFLSFKFLRYNRERDHLRLKTNEHDPDRIALIEQMKRLHASGQTQRQIAKALNISPATVNRYIHKMTNK
ncbi:MAG TPA: AAA family ATPase [Pyrinomonadaceae bacterium]|nr:AAA family ATPase [Pyrinomonadaceae bacterium]